MEKTLLQLRKEQILTDTRNANGVKDSTNLYRTVNGNLYKHWSAFQTKEECQQENPEMTFIQRGEDIYYRV